jgi:DNA-binding transcriptional LysR family regulator
MLACVGAGLGITLLPRSAVEARARAAGLRLQELKGKHALMTIGLIRRRNASRHPGLEAFLELLERPEATAA